MLQFIGLIHVIIVYLVWSCSYGVALRVMTFESSSPMSRNAINSVKIMDREYF